VLDDGSPCDDGEQCTTESCQAGTCTPVPLTETPCDDGSACTQNDTCQAGTCAPGAAPAPVCKQSLIVGKSSLLMKDKASGDDKLVWRWIRGQQTDASELGDPPSTTSYAFCVFDESGVTPQLVMERAIPAGSNWSANGSGFKYKDREGTNHGFTKAILKAGEDLSAKMLVKGKGANLDLGSVAVDQLSSVRVQLLNATGCWEAHYSSSGNDPGTFKAKAD
jgi:hypothetical protein